MFGVALAHLPRKGAKLVIEHCDSATGAARAGRTAQKGFLEVMLDRVFVCGVLQLIQWFN